MKVRVKGEYGEMKKGRKRTGGFLAYFLMAAMLLTLLAGCGNQGAGNSADGTGDPAASVVAGDEESNGQESGGTQQGQSADPTAMGRYVEETTDMSERISGYRNKIFRLADGELIIKNGSDPLLVSKDNGVTWEEEDREWLARMREEKIYIDDINIGADHTTAVVYDGSGGENFTPQVLVIKADGTEIPVELPFPGEELYLINTAVSDDGRVFLSIMGGEHIYEVQEDGSCEIFLTEESLPWLMQFRGNLLIMDGPGYKAPLIYDVEKGEHIEDEVLEDFIKENYPNGNSYSVDDGYELYFFMGEENVLYLAGKKGLHRHVIGGGAMEQVIDGNLCTLNNPAYHIEGMVMLENREFLALFTGAKLSRFVYDPDIPTVPGEKLKVYSLKDNKTIRQSIALYQTANPDVFMEYEVGMSEGSSVTREDALKSLNTKIMAGEGPDILVLDGLPLDSYVEKGMLLDMAPLLGSFSGEEELFTNLVEAMKTGEAVYAMPCEIEIPIVGGEQDYISGMDDLTGIADGIEKLRLDYPGKNILDICSDKGVMRFFSMVCAPAWIQENGELDKEKVAEFLEQTKRIYDAQRDGLPAGEIEKYQKYNESWLAEYGESRDDSRFLRTGDSAITYISGMNMIIRGAIDSFEVYSNIVSVNRVKGYENNAWKKMDGQSKNVFCAVTMLGINAASSNAEQAQDFVRLCLGKENQGSLFYGFPVNQAAFEEKSVPVPGRVSEDGAYSWITVMYEDDRLIEFIAYWPDEEQTAKLRECIETADTVYIEDTVLESAVYKEGAEYLKGRQSLEETLEEIGKQVALYMAE